MVTYAKNRGLTGEIAKRFDLGFAPPGWSGLFDHFKHNLEVVKDLEEMGLLVAKKEKKGEYYDRFRDRLMFPIHNAKGNIIAFGGRVLSEEDKPKYLNSPETPIFHKSRELTGYTMLVNIRVPLIIYWWLRVIWTWWHCTKVVSLVRLPR